MNQVETKKRMLKFSSLLSLAAFCLIIAGCQPGDQGSGKKPVSEKIAPTNAEAMSTKNNESRVFKPTLPMVDATNLFDAMHQAETAFAAGSYEAGKQNQSGALEWYLAILQFNSDNANAQAGLKSTVDALIPVSRQSLRDGNLLEAKRLLQVLAFSRVVHPEIDNLQQELAKAEKAEVWQQKAFAFEQQKPILASDAGNQIDNAVAAYRMALKQFPEYQPALQAVDRLRSQRERAALSLAKQSKFEAALIALKQAEMVDGTSPLYQMTASHVRGRLNQAIREKIVLANIALDGLRIVQAKEYYEQAKKILSTHPEVIALAKRLDAVKHYERFKPHQVFSDVWTMSSLVPEMVVIPYGQFQMGAPLNLASAPPAELPRHAVKFERGFAIARNEITVGQFRQFIESSAYQTRANMRGWSMVFDEKGGSMTKRENIDWRHDHLGRIAKDELPVVHVNLQDAVEYAKWLSSKTGATYRLPSEAEFEYVLRSGSDTIYPWGNSAPVKVVANLAGAGDKSTQNRSWGNAIAGYRDFHWGAAAVRSFPQEPWGTFDISGNVDEWVSDCWHDSYQRAPADGSAWVNPGCVMGVSRGASWASSLNEARTSFRAATLLKTHNARIGFRVVREL